MSLETVLYCDLIIYCYSLIRNYERYHIYIVGCSRPFFACNKHGDTLNGSTMNAWVVHDEQLWNSKELKRSKKNTKRQAESPRRIVNPSPPPAEELNRFLDRKLFRDKIDWPVLLAQLLTNVPPPDARTCINFLYTMCKVDAL